MTIPAGPTPVEVITPTSYTQQTGLDERNAALAQDFNVLMDAMNRHFASDSRFESNSNGFSGSASLRLQDDGYGDLKNQFYAPNSYEMQDRDNTAGKAPGVDEALNRVMHEMDLSTMNNLIFGITTRLGSSINQLVRGA